MEKAPNQITIHGRESALYPEVISFLNSFESQNQIEVRTSGSTGNSKIYNVEKQRFIRSAKRTCDFFGLKESDQAFLCISPEYIGGKMMIVRSIVSKMDLHLGNLSSFPFIEKRSYDFAAFVPLQIKSILDKDPKALQSIKNIIIGGGAIDQETEDQLVALDINAYSTFGMTETLSHIALRKVGTSNFKVLDGIRIKTDSNDRLIIMDKELTGVEELQTNDIIRLNSENEFEWLGRYDNVVNSGGVKIYPEKIEKKLSAIITSPFFIDKEKDSKFGEKLILVVEGEKVNLPDLATCLDRYEIPKAVYFLPRFEYTETGKIQRNKTLTLLNIER